MSGELPKTFRKLNVTERREALREAYGLTSAELDAVGGRADTLDLADIMVEGSIGTYRLPLGLAGGFLIDEENYAIPMATEEPSVVIAASHGAMLVKSGGGFSTKTDESITSAQVFLTDTARDALEKIRDSGRMIGAEVNRLIPRMVERGGGFRDLEAMYLKSGILCVTLDIDVCDAMGANVANTVAEKLKTTLAALSGGRVLMAILTNDAHKRKASATFSIPVRFLRQAGLDGAEVASRIEMASRIAEEYPARAVTHNKGIMNGISALALATGNDTRAVEAAAHSYAAKDGRYQPLTVFRKKDGYLNGAIEVPLALGSVGGAMGVWKPSQVALKILGFPRARRLCAIAASLGLAQNLAALLALVTEGIQGGHMKMHAARAAYKAGARGKDARDLAARLACDGAFDSDAVKKAFEQMKKRPL